MTVTTSLDVEISVAATETGPFTVIDTVTSASKSDARTAVTQAYLGKAFAKSITLERTVSIDLTIHADEADAGLGIVRDAYEANSQIFIKRSNEPDTVYPCTVATYNESSSSGSVVEVSAQLLLSDDPVTA